MQRNRKIKPFIRGISCRDSLVTRTPSKQPVVPVHFPPRPVGWKDTGRTMRGSPSFFSGSLQGIPKDINIVLQQLTGSYWMGSPSSVQHLFIYYARMTVTRTPMTMPHTRSFFSISFFCCCPSSSTLGDDGRLNNKELGVPVSSEEGSVKKWILATLEWKFCIGKF